MLRYLVIRVSTSKKTTKYELPNVFGTVDELDLALRGILIRDPVGTVSERWSGRQVAVN